MGYHHESRPTDDQRLYGFPVRGRLSLLSSVSPLEGTEQLNGLIFTIVQFKGTPQDWLDLLRQANDTEFGLDESTLQSTTVAGHTALSYQAGPFQEYIVSVQPGRLLLIDNGARVPEHQQVIDALALLSTPSTATPSPTSTDVLLNHFMKVGYQFGRTNRSPQSSTVPTTYHAVTSIRIEHGEVIIDYAEHHGTIIGQFLPYTTPTTLTGRWIEDDARGYIELHFSDDFSSAKGFWNECEGCPMKGGFIQSL